LIRVDGEVLRAIAPRVSGFKAKHQNAICDALSAGITNTLQKYEINTLLRIAHFLSQACHESDGFCTTEEYASGAAYEGRADLGNTQPGDGHRFKGRGLFQLTGRANYRSFGPAVGLDLVANPAAAADPLNSLAIACEYWKRKNLNRFADNDDIVTITKRINGGLNGIESRRAYLAKAKTVLAGAHAAATTGHETTAMPVLRRGSKGEAVANLQSRLIAAGYRITRDGDFGAGTERAVLQFQAARKKRADGIVGPETWTALLETAQMEDSKRRRETTAMPVLRRGSKGKAVANLQSCLRAAGYRIGEDGDFGAATERAVLQFQTAKRKAVDGIVGPETWAALLGDVTPISHRAMGSADLWYAGCENRSPLE